MLKTNYLCEVYLYETPRNQIKKIESFKLVITRENDTLTDIAAASCERDLTRQNGLLTPSLQVILPFLCTFFTFHPIVENPKNSCPTFGQFHRMLKAYETKKTTF